MHAAQVFLVVLVSSSVACKSPIPADSKDGQAIFAAYCASCHGADGRPPAAQVARLGVKDLTRPELRGRITPELVARQVLRGSDNKLMPAFEGLLHEIQINAVAQWVASPQFATPPP